MTGDKAQWIRLVDVFLLGPYLIWLGARLGRRAPGLVLIGGATILYNGINWAITYDLAKST